MILVIDDNAMIRSTIRDFLVLNDPECLVLEAANGEEGLALAHTEKPDVIILDAVLPEMDGYAVARHLRDEPDTRHIPLIAISTVFHRNPVAASLRDLSDASLSKPFSISDLLTAVATVSPKAQPSSPAA
jgi:CheY-like chemotaxis protein